VIISDLWRQRQASWRAAGGSIAVKDWAERFEAGFAYIAGRFGRVEPRRQARAFLLGLLSDVDTRSCWQLAEGAGDRTPHRMQRLSGEAVWDANAVRDDVRRYVVDALGDPGTVLIINIAPWRGPLSSVAGL
jgi:SRSO17 transposase